MKTLFILLLLLFSFGTGYYFGMSGKIEIKNNFTRLKDEMAVKTRGLEAEVSSMRARMNLIEAREFLGMARSEVQNKNFGEAEERINRAKERVAKAISLSSDEQKKRLAPFQTEIDSIQKELNHLGPKVGTKLEAVERELEKIAG